MGLQPKKQQIYEVSEKIMLLRYQWTLKFTGSLFNALLNTTVYKSWSGILKYSLVWGVPPDKKREV